MTTMSEWGTRFENFLSQVLFEKRSSSRLVWTRLHDEIVSMYYGIGTEPQTIEQIGKYFSLQDGRIKHLLHQARRMYARYYEAKAKNEAILARRTRLGQDIRKVLA